MPYALPNLDSNSELVIISKHYKPQSLIHGIITKTALMDMLLLLQIYCIGEIFAWQKFHQA